MTNAEALTGLNANFFTFTGKDDTQIIYSTSSTTGEPQFTYRDHTRDLSFHGDSIEVAASPLGMLVTVLLEADPDLRTLTATLVLPDINLGDRQLIRFSTVVILTTHHTSIGGPALVTGPLQTYQVVELSGVAQHVEF
ncbi:MAG: hypothetical protein ACRDRU_07120 [Pseudonocardiaceae bacterium]